MGDGVGRAPCLLGGQRMNGACWEWEQCVANLNLKGKGNAKWYTSALNHS